MIFRFVFKKKHFNDHKDHKDDDDGGWGEMGMRDAGKTYLFTR